VLSQGISTGKVSPKWVSFTVQALHRGGRAAIISIISYCPIPRIRRQLPWGFLQPYGIFNSFFLGILEIDTL